VPKNKKHRSRCFYFFLAFPGIEPMNHGVRTAAKRWNNTGSPAGGILQGGAQASPLGVPSVFAKAKPRLGITKNKKICKHVLKLIKLNRIQWELGSGV
jgi:hypothetical protein